MRLRKLLTEHERSVLKSVRLHKKHAPVVHFEPLLGVGDLNPGTWNQIQAHRFRLHIQLAAISELRGFIPDVVIPDNTFWEEEKEMSGISVDYKWLAFHRWPVEKIQGKTVKESLPSLERKKKIHSTLLNIYVSWYEIYKRTGILIIDRKLSDIYLDKNGKVRHVDLGRFYDVTTHIPHVLSPDVNLEQRTPEEILLGQKNMDPTDIEGASMVLLSPLGHIKDFLFQEEKKTSVFPLFRREKYRKQFLEKYDDLSLFLEGSPLPSELFERIIQSLQDFKAQIIA